MSGDLEKSWTNYFSFFTPYMLEVSHQCQPTLNGLVVKLHLLGGLFTYIIQNFFVSIIIPSLLLFIYFINISMWLHKYLLHTFSYNPISHYHIIYFVIKIVPALAIRNSFRLVLWHTSIIMIFKHSLTFWHYKMVQACFLFCLFQF